MHGTAYTWIVERLLLVVDPDRLNDALVEVGGTHPRRILYLLGADRVEQPRIVEFAGEQGGTQFWREGGQVIDLQAIDIGETGVPVVGVFLHDPYFFVHAPDMLERAGTGEIHHATQVIVVVL